MRKIYILILSLLCILPSMGPASDTVETSITRETVEAVSKGLSYLASIQNENGSWNCRVGYKLNEGYYGEKGQHVGVTAIACMAYLASGNTPKRGPYARTVSNGLAFVLDCVRKEDGYITHDGSRMYSHAFATMFLAEIYGMDQRSDVKQALKRAVGLIVNSQNNDGGWRYQPIAVDADLSVSVTVLQALRAARNTGISVPKTTIDRAMKYVYRCATRRGFAYQLSAQSYGTRYTYAITAAGVVSLYSAGEYDAEAIQWGLSFLEMTSNSVPWGKYHYFYAHYYAVQAMYQAGGRYWRHYFPGLYATILNHQNVNGSWTDDVGQSYATAMACLILMVPGEYLPIFQK